MLTWTRPDRAALPELVDALAAWTPAGAPDDPLHVGDLGWFLRFEEDAIAEGVVRFDREDELVAMALQDGPVLRFAMAPRARGDESLAPELEAAVQAVCQPGEAWVDVCAGPLRDHLQASGWSAEEEGWPVFVRSLAD